jgi:hypothetical protein
MFVKISQSDLSDVNKVGALCIRGWHAVDTANCGYLYQTSGRGKYGLPKFILVLVVNPPDRFDEVMEAYTRWERITSVIRAWSLEEAIQIANTRLPRLQKRAQLQRSSEGVLPLLATT